MQPKSADSDPFDLEFDADDEFAAPSNIEDDWRETPIDRPTQAPHPDPFAGLNAGGPNAGGLNTGAMSAGALPGGGLGSGLSGALAGDEAWRDDELDVPPGATPHPDPFAGLAPPPEPAADPFADLPPAQPRARTVSPEAQETPDLAPIAPHNPVGEIISHVSNALGEPVVPRITIHAFCESPETGDMIRGAAGDRRMERASTVVRDGGLTAAADYYQNQPTPSLVIVESSDPAPRMLALLDRLAEVCDPGTKVIVIGQANDIALYRELMRRGVSEYLVPPLRTLQVIAAVTTLYADPSAPFIGRQIAFCSAKGGAGASTLAHNVAHEISERMNAGTVIVDLDLAFGTAGLNFNHDPLQGILDALSQPDRLDPVLMDRMMVKHTDHLSLFAAPATLDQDYAIDAEIFEEVIQKIRAAAPYVVLDLPHAWTVWKRRMLLTADDLVIVAEPDLASLRNAKNIIDLVKSARPNDAPPKVVLNKVGLPGRPEIPVKDFGEALGVQPVMAIAFDAKAFGQAANNGQMISEVAAKTKAAESIDQLTRLMLNQREATPAPAAKTSILSSLLKRK
ncbi:MAG: AAA family ATPase [Proteobacteria bacterium]|nr:AAA family ATPase [Pseudomonadota bacterium]